MSLENVEEIQQFLVLQQKTIQDLRTLCEGMELSTEGTKDQLVERLLTLSINPQTDTMSAQLIALRTRFGGEEIPRAEAFIQKVRQLIYNGKGNTKDFSVLNGKNQPYVVPMRYAKVSTETLDFILNSQMIYPHQSQRELVKAIKDNPDRFLFHLVNRAYGKEKTFIMLHVEPKETK